MKSTGLLHDVQKVVRHELERINADRAPLHSPREAYAILKEKSEDARDKCNQTEHFIQIFRERISTRTDAYYVEALMFARDCAIECAVEAIRVAIAAQNTADCIEKASKQEEV